MNVHIEHVAAFTQIMTRGMQEAAHELEQMLAIQVAFQLPAMVLCAPDEVCQAIRHHETQHFLAVRLQLHAMYEGALIFVMPIASAVQLVTQVTHRTPPQGELDVLGLGMWSEIGLAILTPIAQAVLRLKASPVQCDLPPTLRGTLAYILRTVCHNTAKACVVQLTCLFGSLRMEGHVLFLWHSDFFVPSAAVMVTAWNGGDNDDR